MIVRHFLQWVRSAPAVARADATGALARAYLYSGLSAADRAATEDALIMMLDDSSPLVRRAMAEALGSSPYAPPAVIMALATDQRSIAAIVLSRSPLLLDTDLIDRVGAGEQAAQAAIASRSGVPCAVAAAIAEVGSAESCLILIENPRASIVPFSLDRIIARHGHLAAVREALFARDDLMPAARQALTAMLSQTLVDFVASRSWLKEDRARQTAGEACERVTVALAATATDPQMRPLMRHLRETGQLTAGLVLRALLSGNLFMFEEALAELADIPLGRVSGLVYDARRHGLRAVVRNAGLPDAVYPAVRAAIDAMQEVGYVNDFAGATRLNRRIVERVLTACEEGADADSEPLLVLLRRFALEAVRDEARAWCEETAAA